MALVVVLAACTGGRVDPSGSGGSTGAPSSPTPAPPSTDAPSAPEPARPRPPDPAADLPAPTEVATGLGVPWGIAFLPGGDALVSERDTGRVLRIPAGAGTPDAGPVAPTVAATVPGVAPLGEGGLLGLAVSPRHADDGLVYAFLTTAQDNRVVRFRLDDPADVEVVVAGIERAAIHNGGRIVFGPDGRLYVATGDAARGELAADPDSLNGKVLRLEPDGSVPSDNPTPGSPVFTSGHRNVQGLTWDDDGRPWASELGERRWDELNLLTPGADHGWPQVEGHGGGAHGFVDPALTWEPAEASPSGLAAWRGALFVAALRGERLWQVPLAATGAAPGVGAAVPRLEDTYGRLRTVVVAPDGALWVATSNTDGRGAPRPGDDRILRFSP